MDKQNAVAIPKIGEREQTDLVSAEPAMVTKPENSPIPFVFDDLEE